MNVLPVLRDPAGRIAVADPDTGEMWELEHAPAPVLAATRERLDDLARDARDARSTVDAELERRMGGERSMDVGSHLVERQDRREWNPDATWLALRGLLDAGLVTLTEVEQAMPEVAVRKPDGRKLNALLTRLAGTDPVAAQPLAQARAERSYLRVRRTAVEGTVSS